MAIHANSFRKFNRRIRRVGRTVVCLEFVRTAGRNREVGEKEERRERDGGRGEGGRQIRTDGHERMRRDETREGVNDAELERDARAEDAKEEG